MALKEKMEAMGKMDKVLPTMEKITPALRKPANGMIYGFSALSILLALVTARKNLSLANFFGLWAPTILGLAILFKENQLLDIERKRIALL